MNTVILNLDPEEKDIEPLQTLILLTTTDKNVWFKLTRNNCSLLIIPSVLELIV